MKVYRVALCRAGKSAFKANIKCKGIFYREFQTLDEMSKYFLNSKRKLFWIPKDSNLTNAEINMFAKKIKAMDKKSYTKKISSVEDAVEDCKLLIDEH